MDIRTGLIDIHTRYDDTSYFQSEVIAKKAENAVHNLFVLHFVRMVYARIMKVYIINGDNQPHIPSGYDVASCFRSGKLN